VKNQVVYEVRSEHLDSPGAICIVDSSPLNISVLKQELATLQSHVAFLS